MSLRRGSAAFYAAAGGAPTDWYFLWDIDAMAVGTSTRTIPDASGNSRPSNSANWTVAQGGYVGAHRVITAPDLTLAGRSIPSGSADRTAVWVFKRPPSGASNELFRALDANGVLVAISRDGSASYTSNGAYAAANPPIASGALAVVVARFRTGSGGLSPKIEVRSNGTTVADLTSTDTTSRSLTSVGFYPVDNNVVNGVTRFGMFNRRLTDDECVALEADLRSTYGI